MKRRFVKARYLSFLTFGLLTACVTAERDEAPEAASSARRRDFGSVLGQSPILLKGKKIVRRTTTKDAPKVNKFLWQCQHNLGMSCLCHLGMSPLSLPDEPETDTPSRLMAVGIPLVL